jgi:hypothetical protein
MNEDDQRRIEQLLRQASGRTASPLQRDLWPAMLKRLEARSGRVPWFDWALLAILATWLIFFPGAIPVLLYHL